MAALPDAVPVDKLESLVVCSICLEILDDPCTLACFHSFCKRCLEKFIKTQRAKAVAAGKKIEDFNCPSCRFVFTAKQDEDVARIRCSHFIRNMLEVVAFQRQASETKVAKCSHCEESSCCRCVTCELFMCRKCSEIHGSWPGFKGHSILTMKELTLPVNQEKIKTRLHCDEHSAKKLKFYCETCKQLICRYCMDFDHVRPDHSCVPIEKVAEKHREDLKSSFDVLNRNLDEGNQALQAISNATQALKDNAETAKWQIILQEEEVKKVLLEKLEERAQKKIEEVVQKYSETHVQLTLQKNKVESFVNKVKDSVNLSKNLLQKGNNEEIIASQKMMKERVQNVRSECPTRMTPVHDGRLHYNECFVDVGHFTKLLDSLGRVDCLSYANKPLSEASVILKGLDDYVNQMDEWLKEPEFQWRLCYRATRDGWKASDFHANCDDKGPTVVLVKVNEYIFGGFTDQSWAGEGVKYSTSSFLFSLKNKDNVLPFKAPVKKFETAIFAGREHGPSFGNQYGCFPDLYIASEAQTSDNSYCRFATAYQPPAGYMTCDDRSNSLLAGSRNFQPTEIEVFY